MPARGSSAVIVNHRVALSGTKARSAVTSDRVEYIATRPGCDRAATEADVERAREREALVGYVGCRPGSTALFGADGAVVCSVVAVRREDCERFGLDTKEGWQAFARANLTREYARLMGIPESRVEWVAAHHLNSSANQHIHVLAYDKEGGFDRLLAKPDIERVRENFTEAAIRPEVERLGIARELARDNAARAVRAVGAGVLGEGVALPAEGRISYAHLRRYRPDAARRVEAAVGRAAKASPELRRAMSDYSEACREIADLRRLAGAERAAYLAKAETDMRSRACNAALREVAPDRAERPADPRAPRAAPDGGPATARRREKVVRRELSACTSARQKASISDAARRQHPVPRGAVSGCPTIEAIARRSPELLGSVLDQATKAAPQARREDLGDEAGREAMHALPRLASTAIYYAPGPLGDAGRVAAAVVRPIKKTMTI